MYGERGWACTVGACACFYMGHSVKKYSFWHQSVSGILHLSVCLLFVFV